jgi:hypothetical protein
VAWSRDYAVRRFLRGAKAPYSTCTTARSELGAARVRQLHITTGGITEFVERARSRSGYRCRLDAVTRDRRRGV